MTSREPPFEWPDGTQDATRIGANWRSHALPQWPSGSFVGVAHSFAEAAEAVFESLEGRSPDVIYLPLQYLWRHHIELMLKANIHIWALLSGSRTPDLIGHNLGELFDTFSALVVDASEDTSDVVAARQALDTFLALEPHHDASRYPTDRNGRRYERPERVDLAELRRAARAVASLLSGAYDQADAYLDAMPDS